MYRHEYNLATTKNIQLHRFTTSKNIAKSFRILFVLTHTGDCAVLKRVTSPITETESTPWSIKKQDIT